ncbi:36727_t:CDS:1, partial [Gigaspora margarita]
TIIFEKISAISTDNEKSNNNRRLLFRYDQMTKEKWEEYSGDLEKYLKNRPSINLLLESNLEELCESVDTTKLDSVT